MALRHAAALVLCAASIQLAGEPALAQNAPINNAPITNVPNIVIPDALPDLVPAKATFVLTCAGDKKSLTASYAVTVVNKGPYANADISKAAFNRLVEAYWGTVTGTDNNLEKLAKPAPKQFLGGPMLMKPGQSVGGTMTILNIPHHKKGVAHPQYVLWMRVDPLLAVPESNEENNFIRQYFFDPCPK